MKDSKVSPRAIFSVVILAAVAGFGTAVGTDGFGLIKTSIQFWARHDVEKIHHFSSKNGAVVAEEVSKLDIRPNDIWGSISMVTTLHIWYVENENEAVDWEYEYMNKPYDSSKPEEVPIDFTNTNNIVPLGFGTKNGNPVIAYFKATKSSKRK